MAKVKIQGNASGTGVLTVTAPNTSTDRTITLPDSTDTLAVNSDVTNKLPLAGGTLTGTLNVTNELPIIKLTDTNSGGYYSSVNQEGSSFKILADEGNVGSGQIRFYVGSGAEKVRILSSGGITFNGDTAAANALDDYEHATWTPTLTAASGSGFQYSFQSGYYTKVGSSVIIHGRIITSSIGSASGNLRISGLPFVPVENDGGWSATTIGHGQGLNITAGIALAGYVRNDSSEISLHKWSSGVGTAGLTAAEWSADGGIMFSTHYTTAS